jgi:hypothetical protein
VLLAVSDSDLAVSVARLEVVAERLRLRLPDDYKSFLIEHNGGIPSPNTFAIQGMEHNPRAELQRLFGIDTRVEENSISWNREVFAGRVPNEYLPVGCTPSGDLVCIGVEGARFGAVVLWDSYAIGQRSEWSRTGYSNIFPVGDSFQEFLAGLDD